jgi:hypothetical protein
MQPEGLWQFGYFSVPQLRDSLGQDPLGYCRFARALNRAQRESPSIFSFTQKGAKMAKLPTADALRFNQQFPSFPAHGRP